MSENWWLGKRIIFLELRLESSNSLFGLAWKQMEPRLLWLEDRTLWASPLQTSFCKSRQGPMWRWRSVTREPATWRFTPAADILVVAAGKPKAITADVVKEGAVVIDVGVNRIGMTPEGKAKLCGDVDFDGIKEKASMITPVPEGWSHDDYHANAQHGQGSQIGCRNLVDFLGSFSNVVLW
jgi:hypothetical protein